MEYSVVVSESNKDCIECDVEAFYRSRTWGDVFISILDYDENYVLHS